MSIVTFEQRKEKITKIEHIDEQIDLARSYVKRLRNKAKNCTGTLTEKLALNEDVKQAELAFRKLRMASFEIEDDLLAKSKLN
ncbi:hypothetical protein [Vibrio casei]|uniref:hypothetical protein n=1 Tax=Vibrio casei TaxID=673372 RepID=UPI001EE1810F|nr:hypothetical protein [Vibrio casei]